MKSRTWCWVGASSVGTSHIEAKRGCDDSAACVELKPAGNSLLVAVVSDGAGSADFGSIGSRFVVRGFARSASKYLNQGGAIEAISEEVARDWIDAVRDSIFAAAKAKSASPRDFAATLVGVIVGPQRVVICHIGDGACVLRGRDTSEWIVPSWPAHGEYASSTNFVTDDPEAQLRVIHLDGRYCDVALFSDGIERMVLDFGTKSAYGRFFDVMFAPLKEEHPGRNRLLSRRLRDYLASKAVIDRTDDDKTLVMARRIEASP
jgi:hypothetical protein